MRNIQKQSDFTYNTQYIILKLILRYYNYLVDTKSLQRRTKQSLYSFEKMFLSEELQYQNKKNFERQSQIRNSQFQGPKAYKDEITRKDHVLLIKGSSLPTVKQIEIQIQLGQSISVQSIPQEKIQQRKLSKDLQELEKLDLNLFIGSNPGLFYSNKSNFDHSQQFSLKKLVSIQKIPLAQTGQQFDQNQTQKSGITIYDNINEQQSSQQLLFKDKVQTQNILKEVDYTRKISKEEELTLDKSCSKIKGNPTRQNQTSQINCHCKHCLAVDIKKSKERQFRVPVSMHPKRLNKQKLKDNEYSAIKDNHLVNFFVSKEKEKYVSKYYSNQLGSSLLSSQKVRKFQQCQNRSNLTNKLHSSKDDALRSNLISGFSSPRGKNSLFQAGKHTVFQRTEYINTKFLVKVVPSNKTKRLFNQSTSTLINHNYRPSTLYRQGLRQNRHSPTRRSEFIKLTLEDKNIQTTIQNPSQLSCDSLAQKNSYKKMTQNSKKGRKIIPLIANTKSIQGISGQSRELLISQNKTEIRPNLSQEDNLNKHCLQSNSSPVYFNMNNKQSNSSPVQFNANDKENNQFVDSEYSSKDSNTQRRKNQHLKKLSKLQRAVVSKIGIVKKMGVKIALFQPGMSRSKLTL